MTRFVRFTGLYENRPTVWIEASSVMLVGVGTDATVITLSHSDHDCIYVKETPEVVVALLEGRAP
jgi:hypothetical protein